MKKTVSSILITLMFGYFALSPSAQAIVPPPDGGYPGGNTAEGQAALLSLTTGGFNTAVGFLSLRSDTTGQLNTAIGAGALLANTADNNTATGAGALLSNASGGFNTATGAFAMFSNTAGFQNAAIGYQALFTNTSGGLNTAIGMRALFSNLAFDNTAVGEEALYSNIAGVDNTAVGVAALVSNQSGNINTAVGSHALLDNTGTANIALGHNAGKNLTTGNYNIDIFDEGVAADSGTIRIGTTGFQTATYIAGISGQTASGGVAVYVNADGKLGTATSSARFKDEIKPMDKASEAILALKPITFRYKKEIDSKGIPQFGLVAEEVEKVNPDLVARDRDGKTFTVRYDAVNAMLLNEFLKEHRKVEEQQAAISELKAFVAQQQKEFQAAIAEQRKELESRLKQQDAKIQKVSAQLELNALSSATLAKNH